MHKRFDAVKVEQMAAGLSGRDALVAVACSHDLIAELVPSLHLAQAIERTILEAKDRCLHCQRCFGAYSGLVDETAPADVPDRTVSSC